VIAVVIAVALGAVLVGAHELAWRWLGGSWRALAGCAVGGYVYAAALALVLFAVRGVPTERGWYAVDAVLTGFDATGKLAPGDLIVAVDGNLLTHPATPALVDAVNARAGAPVVLAVVRAGIACPVVVQPKLDHPDGRPPVWVLGIRPRSALDYELDATRAGRFALVAPFAAAREVVGEVRDALAPDEAGPYGPKGIVDEYNGRAPDGWRGWMLGLRAASVGWLALIILDLARVLVTGRSPGSKDEL
jgi:hypothetical protein